MKAKLEINGVSINLGFKTLEFIADILPDCEDNSLIFHELAKSKSSEVRIAVANKRYLMTETAKLLLKDSSIMVLCQIIRTDIGVSCLNKNILTRFIELNSVRLLKTIIMELDEIVNEFDCCDMTYLVDLLVQHQDPLIKYELAEMDIPECYLKILADDPDLSVARVAKSNLLELED
ncbi:MAG: hypothetical protein K8S13_22705 [Desulfobacula sp.]|uniref:hypothetical protein n=1 Tax=Desulfobacula sp. TaxID=2593537 RepID=UPI0025C41E39|nr:hypothetical protein [Desulfobacula sp.]MCD4722642.1 hypothetical protein [Desulfobacula sp.]